MPVNEAVHVGWIGLGKLGAVCAAVFQDAGLQVRGYDPYSDGQIPDYETGAADLLPVPRLELRDLAAWADVVFVAVQTPHAPDYGGDKPLPVERRDFEYGYLVNAVRDLVTAARRANRDAPLTVVIVSTVLPGTFNRHLRPLLDPDVVRMVYHPFFIAMGTCAEDFRDPEFLLFGADRPEDVEPLRYVYKLAGIDAPQIVVSIESAELAKVAYNTYISSKIVLANTLMEISEKTGADVDQVSDVLAMGTRRITSSAYMRGGMGDGGGCHPRDLVAMSWLSEQLDLSYDLLGSLADAREAQSAWLARYVERWADLSGLPIILLGKAYKPGVPLTAGSPALLLAHQLGERVTAHIDPYVDLVGAHEHGVRLITFDLAVYVIATAHREFLDLEFAPGSVVVDPFGYLPAQDGVTLVRPGRKRLT